MEHERSVAREPEPVPERAVAERARAHALGATRRGVEPSAVATKLATRPRPGSRRRRGVEDNKNLSVAGLSSSTWPGR